MTVRTKEYNEYKLKMRIELINSMCTHTNVRYLHYKNIDYKCLCIIL